MDLELRVGSQLPTNASKTLGAPTIDGIIKAYTTMSTTMKPYPAYKDSGLPWLAKIPSHWDVRRNGRLFAQRVETGFPDLPILEVSLRTGVHVRDLDNTKRKQLMSNREQYKRAARGDIAYNMMRMWQGAVGVAPTDGLVSPAYVVARPYPETESRFYGYLFRTATYMNEVNKYSRGIVTDRNRLYWDEFKQIPALFPPTEEQRAIAAFLDDHGRAVRRLIGAKRGLIELLNELKRSVIHRATTRGLDPNVGLKPSDINWLGEVPEHWRLCRLKYLVCNVNDQTSTKTAEEIYIALEHVESWSGKVRVPDMGVEFDSHVKKFQPGDILFGKLRPYLAKVTRPSQGGVCVGEFLVLRPIAEEIDPEFLEQRLRSTQIIDLVNSSTFGAKMPRADWAFIGDVVIAYPPTCDEQQKILAAVHQKTAWIDDEISRTQREIDFIREYRTRLIAEIVTGKLDVRGAELPELEETAVLDDVDESEDVADLAEETGEVQAIEEENGD